jgi:hypothetical protein
MCFSGKHFGLTVTGFVGWGLIAQALVTGYHVS